MKKDNNTTDLSIFNNLNIKESNFKYEYKNFSIYKDLMLPEYLIDFDKEKKEFFKKFDFNKTFVKTTMKDDNCTNDFENWTETYTINIKETIHKKIYDFVKKYNKKPNIVFITKDILYAIQKEGLSSPDTWNVLFDSGYSKILGMRAIVSDTMFCVDYIGEFDDTEIKLPNKKTTNKEKNIKSNKPRKIIINKSDIKNE